MYFADHEDESMRRMVAEGRKQEFAAFGFGDDVPNPEEMQTFLNSKLNWQEVNEGKHSEMLAWTKALIYLRRNTLALNNGSMQHLSIHSDDAKRTLVMQRDEVRIVVNLGEQPYLFDLEYGEELQLISRPEIAIANNRIDLPPMTIAVLMCTNDQLADRNVR
jgi:maltooligosyltrehalose trehalohydrolase